ncbi:MAG: condensation domain-containing protein, partial [Opitutaceae bacterium]
MNDTHFDNPGDRLRQAVASGIQPLIGVYDVFSATLAARHFDGLFLSGFGFAASHYGLPDLGFIAWSDILAFAERVRALLPQHHLVVDIDDGYGDPEIAAHVVQRMELAGVSGVVLEDQQRPRRCGHYDGKQILELPQYMAKLERVLEARKNLFVVARTDTKDLAEVERRACAFAEAGADAVLAEALPDLATFRKLQRKVKAPLVCNQIAGGKTPSWSLGELGNAGVGIVIYSTPCLFAAQGAVERALVRLKENDGQLKAIEGGVSLQHCTAALTANLRRETAAGQAERSIDSTVPPAAAPASRRQLLELKLRQRAAALPRQSDNAPAANALIPRLDRDRPPPLSFGQERMWIIDQMDPGRAVYNSARFYRLSGPLDAGVLERSLQEILRRHETLRTVFRNAGGRPELSVLNPDGFSLSVTDLSNHPDAGRVEAAGRLALEQARIPFDLAEDFLLRARLFRLAESDHLFSVSLHHIAWDAWSATVLWSELRALYGAFRSGRPSPLKPLQVQYSDYAAWQRSQLEGERLKNLLS